MASWVNTTLGNTTRARSPGLIASSAPNAGRYLASFGLTTGAINAMIPRFVHRRTCPIASLIA